MKQVGRPVGDLKPDDDNIKGRHLKLCAERMILLY